MDFPECSFPVSMCHHNEEPGWQRKDFADFGSFSQVDCKFQDVKQPAEVKSCPQKGMGIINGLDGNLPPLPLFDHPLSESRVIQDHILCMDHFKDALNFAKSVKYDVDYLPYTHMKNSEFFARFTKCKTLLRKCQDRRTRNKAWMDLKKTIPKEVKDLFRRYKDIAKVPTESCWMGYNQDFYQGLLCHKQSSNSTDLFHAGGDDFKDIYLTTVSHTEDCIPQGNPMSKVTLNEPVYQLSCFHEGLLLARQEKQCVVLTYEECEKIFHESTRTVSQVDDKKLTDVKFSPYRKDELLVSLTAGEVYVWNLDAGVSVSLQKTPKSDCSTPWTSSHFAGHPRQIVISDRFSMELFDHRDNFIKGLELFHLSNSLVKTEERLMAATSIQFPYHLAATDFSLFVVDQRFPGSPVLQWNTESMNSPQYLKSCKFSDLWRDVNSGGSEHFIFLGTQQPGEVLCFSLHLTKGCAPTSRTLPWRVGKIGSVLENENTSYIPQWVDIEKHYEASLAGMTVVGYTEHRKHNLSVYQMDGYGDIYVQDFQLNSIAQDPGFYYLNPPSGETKAAAVHRTADFLFSLDQMCISESRSNSPMSDLEVQTNSSDSDVEVKFTDKGEPTASTSEEELGNLSMTFAEFTNLCCRDKATKSHLVKMECLPQSGPNTKLLLGLKEKEDIHDILIEREEDFEKKKHLLREEYLAEKERLKGKRRSKRMKTEKKFTLRLKLVKDEPESEMESD